MSAAHKSAPIGSLGLKTHRGRPIRTKRFYGLYGHVGRRRRGSKEGIARASRIGPAVGPRRFPLGSWVKREAAFTGWWERTNALRITLPRIAVKHAVV
jgi:hypothetical protein